MHKNRRILRLLRAGAWLLPAVCAFHLPAQNATVLTRVSASASDATFLVDGQLFSGAAVFSWPAGSKHTLEIAAWQYTPTLPRGRYVFQHWTSSVGALASPSTQVTITADPGIPWYRADLSTEYTLSLIFFQCDVPPCASPGTIWVNQVAYQQTSDVWISAGSTVTLEATPNSGYVFTGWSQGPGLAPIYSFVLNASTTVYPMFATARPVQLLTSPVGFQLLADRAPVTTPVTLDWGIDTIHSLAPVSPQLDSEGRQWVFQSWSDGGERTHTYQVPPGSPTLAITAQFVRAVPVLLLTDPPGLTVTLDGVDGLSPRFAAWGPGEVHTVSAPPHQVDAAGGPWTFRQWSSGPAATQTIRVSDAQVDTGIRMSAAYDPLSKVHVDSTPSGLNLTVDGAACQTPCDVERAVGTVVRVAGPASIGASPGTRLDLGSWDGTSAGVLTTVAGYQKVTAHYQWSYLLSTATSPTGAGSWRLSPATVDGFYLAGTSVTIGIDAANGMKFRQWGQDLSGSANPSTLLMNAPHLVRAIFDQAPDTPTPPHVSNAAGDTPVFGVAPGSIAALFGSALANTTTSTAADPLPQSLGGVSLVCSGRVLSLMYVSPQQINFQVPGDLKPGKYQLEVQGASAPITTEFEVVPNAPGLLVASHLDGTPITADAPSHPGETIMVYGTGLGSYQPAPLDGFRVPASPVFTLADPVTVVVQSRTVTPDLAAAAPGYVGIARVQFRLPEDLDRSVPTDLTVHVGGAASNTLALPLQ